MFQAASELVMRQITYLLTYKTSVSVAQVGHSATVVVAAVKTTCFVHPVICSLGLRRVRRSQRSCRYAPT